MTARRRGRVTPHTRGRPFSYPWPMRIVAGTYRGRRLAAPRGRDVRPTSDRVREAVFSILGDLEGACVLDLFAGTGAMGLEALSRGAVHATFVEIDRQAHDVVRRNIDATVSGDDGATELVKGDAARVARSLALAERRFDLVIFDPPYDRSEELVRDLAGTVQRLCHPHTRVVVELSRRHEALIDEAVSGWDCELLTKRTYGDTTIAVLAGPAGDDQ
jgi:16S rRNA (guanine966-N2)-methyltransferase